MSEKRICKHCNKALRKVGYDRVNGANHDDWAERDYHKKCWKIVEPKKRLTHKWKITEEDGKVNSELHFNFLEGYIDLRNNLYINIINGKSN